MSNGKTQYCILCNEAGKFIAELEAENQRLRETRVPDELLADLIWGCKSHYQELGDVEEAEAILAKRKEAHND